MTSPVVYPTDVSDDQWKILSRLLPAAKKRGRPIVYDRRRIVNAILYVVRSGCQWRMLPKDFPPWKTVYQIFYRWRLNGLWDKVHDALRTKVRQQEGENHNRRQRSSIHNRSKRRKWEAPKDMTLENRSMAVSDTLSLTPWAYCWRSSFIRLTNRINREPAWCCTLCGRR